MPEERAVPLLNAIEAFNGAGVEGALPYLDPEIEWWAPPDWLEDRLYRGHDGIRRLAAHWTQLFDEYQLRLERVVDVDEARVVVLLYQLGRIVGTGDRIEAPIGYVAEIRDEVVARVDIYFSWEAALEAAGVAA
ncbi:MAG TPA: nuclear transport factor 2 family protein [Solirubrobacterales bacterium]|nr:nuclear transport factor 2 family protein [Solirubrobacterales bacterium]